MSTTSLSAKNVQRKWHLINAEGKVLGRLATDIAKILMGKQKVVFVPYLDSGDYVVVTNAAKVKVTGKKAADKKYTRHSGYPGGLKQETFDELMVRKPTYVIEHAVWGMLPKNKLGKKILNKLKVFAGEEHPFVKQLQNQGR